VLKGSGETLVLPNVDPQQIVLIQEDVAFIEVSFSVKHAASVALMLTLSSLQVVNIKQPAADGPVSNARTVSRS